MTFRVSACVGLACSDEPELPKPGKLNYIQVPKFLLVILLTSRALNVHPPNVHTPNVV